MFKAIVYVDGGSRGNPGPAAIGVVIKIENERENVGNYKYGQYIGTTTNNEAEYQAVIFALRKLKLLLGSKKAKQTAVTLFGDSELVMNQLAGRFKIKEKEFYPLFIKIWNLKQDFAEVDFIAIPRIKNQIADQLVNQALDAIRE